MSEEHKSEIERAGLGDAVCGTWNICKSDSVNMELMGYAQLLAAWDEMQDKEIKEELFFLVSVFFHV